MKKMYQVLLAMTIFCFFFTLTSLLKEATDLSIPTSKASIEIEAWDQKKSAKDIYNEIKKYAQKKHLNLHKVVYSTDSDGKELKKIFTFSANDSSNYSYDTASFQTKVLFFDSSELTDENVVGNYDLTTSVPKNVKEDFHSLGLTVTVEKTSSLLLIFESLFTTVGILSIVLIFTTALASIFSKISQMKKYGIWEINGKSILWMSAKDDLLDVLIIVCLTLIFSCMYPLFWQIYLLVGVISSICVYVFNLVSSLIINKSEKAIDKIKGKKASVLSIFLNLGLKMIILVLFVVFAFNLSIDFKRNNEAYKGLLQWEKIDEYYQLNFSNTSNLFPDPTKFEAERKKQFIEINKKLFPLLEEAEKNGGILAVNNQYFLNETEKSSIYTDSVPFMTINHNFLEGFPIIDTSGKQLTQLSDDTLYVLIPENEKAQTQKIEQEVREEFTLIQNVYIDSSANSFKGKLETIYVQSNQKIFNFNANHPEHSLSTNPIMLVVSLKVIGSNIGNLIANISQGHYLFPNKKQVTQFIEKNQLEDDFFGFISAKDSAMAMLKKNRSEYSLKMIAVFVLFTIFILVQFYISISYVELNQKILFLQYIFGVTFFARHYKYSLLSLLLSFSILTIISSFNTQYIPIACALILFEIVLLFFTLIISETFKRLDSIKKEN